MSSKTRLMFYSMPCGTQATEFKYYNTLQMDPADIPILCSTYHVRMKADKTCVVKLYYLLIMIWVSFSKLQLFIIVKRLRRRQYDTVIIETTIGLVLGPFTALYRSFLKRCTLTNKAVGTIWRALSKPPQRRQGPDPRPLWLLVGTPSAFRPELAYRLRVAQPTLVDVPIYFFDILLYHHMFVYHIFMTSPLWLAVGPQSL